MEYLGKISINLSDYRKDGNTSFFGRESGERTRGVLGLQLFDTIPYSVEFILPHDTTSFNPSFYLGLLYGSIATLKPEKFKEKYKFKFDTTCEILINALSNNIDDGFRNGVNSYNFVKNRPYTSIFS